MRALAATLLLAAAAGLAVGPEAAAAPPAGDQGRRLHELFDAEWDWVLAENPVWASLLGDHRWDDRWDDLGLAAFARRDAHRRELLQRLAGFDRDALDEEDRLSLDLLRGEVEDAVESYRLGLHLFALDHMGGLPEGPEQPPQPHTAFRLVESLRFAGEADYQGWIGRLRAFPEYVEQNMALLREGQRVGLVQPRLVIERILPVLAPQLAVTAAESDFFRPFRSFPEGIGAERRKALADEGLRAVESEVLPALRRLERFLAEEVIPAAPEEVGIGHLEGGSERYDHLVRHHTTTGLGAEEIHRLGLAEVARLRAAMEQTKERAGFNGTLGDFFDFLRRDERFYYPDGASLLTGYRALAKRIDPLLVRYFGRLPRMVYGVEPIPEATAPNATTGFYFPAADDGSRAGVYQVNLYRPESRPRWEMVPLTLHEAVPGHHLQVSLAAEIEGLPTFRRLLYHTAYGEGWALYAEWLGYELGLYEDPYDELGQLAYEMWRAVRLVVDTGMHRKGWSRQQAIDYFLDNAPRPRLDVVNEIDRYIATPGQALGYKIGQLKIAELRRQASERLGSAFDVRAFHDLVLGAGSLPLDLLERRVDEWVDRLVANAPPAAAGERP